MHRRGSGIARFIRSEEGRWIALEGNKAPLVVVLIVLIVAAVGFLIYQAKGQAGLSDRQQKAISATQQGPPGTFTPAPR
jgi:hypothetical protein